MKETCRRARPAVLCVRVCDKHKEGQWWRYPQRTWLPATWFIPVAARRLEGATRTEAAAAFTGEPYTFSRAYVRTNVHTHQCMSGRIDGIGGGNRLLWYLLAFDVGYHCNDGWFWGGH